MAGITEATICGPGEEPSGDCLSCEEGLIELVLTSATSLARLSIILVIELMVDPKRSSSSE